MQNLPGTCATSGHKASRLRRASSKSCQQGRHTFGEQYTAGVAKGRGLTETPEAFLLGGYDSQRNGEICVWCDRRRAIVSFLSTLLTRR